MGGWGGIGEWSEEGGREEEEEEEVEVEGVEAMMGEE